MLFIIINFIDVKLLPLFYERKRNHVLLGTDITVIHTKASIITCKIDKIINWGMDSTVKDWMDIDYAKGILS